MADATEESDATKKRNRSQISSTGSTSDIDTSIKTPPAKTPRKHNGGKVEFVPDERSLREIKEIKSQMVQINDKLSKVMTKDDGSLRNMIKDMISQMKDELLKSVEKKIDVLESKLFDKEVENDQLKNKIEKLKEKTDKQASENNYLKHEIRKSEEKTDNYLNDIEQYSRSNNIRISGIKEDKSFKEMSDENLENKNKATQESTGNKTDSINKNAEVRTDMFSTVAMERNGNKELTQTKTPMSESPDQTAGIIIKTLNEKLPGLNLKKEDIDMCHRLGKGSPGKNRQIIVKFTSRLVKNKVMRMKKELPKPIFVYEDLTKLNMQVLLSVKKKRPEEVEYGWFRNGNIMYKDKLGQVHYVQYQDYDKWLNMKWPDQ